MTRRITKIRVTSRPLPARVATPPGGRSFPGAPRRSAMAAIAFHAFALWALASLSMPMPPAAPPVETIEVTLLEALPDVPAPAPSAEPPPAPAPAVVASVEQPEPAPTSDQEPVGVLPNESPLVLTVPMVVADANPEPARGAPVAETVQRAGPAPLSAYWLSVRTAVADTVQYPAGPAIDTNILLRVERTESGFVVAAPAAGRDPFARSVRAAAEQVARRFAPPSPEEPSSAEWTVRFTK